MFGSTMLCVSSICRGFDAETQRVWLLSSTEETPLPSAPLAEDEAACVLTGHCWNRYSSKENVFVFSRLTSYDWNYNVRLFFGLFFLMMDRSHHCFILIGCLEKWQYSVYVAISHVLWWRRDCSLSTLVPFGTTPTLHATEGFCAWFVVFWH